ncbi:MAG TPA: carboxypeptidase regulatory-like domain-containing protein, partial [Verrucomicrobiae bacterium]|nr:carboxypeptidase regulatory-like domain-containing protein [Verrucomicrobiae bacterium]
IGTDVGLSSDEIAAAKFLYGTSATLGQVGMITGTVRMNGVGIRGAVVTAETVGGIVISASASDAAGVYRLPGLPPGNYNLHVSPLDPDSATASFSLQRPLDIAGDFVNATTAFKATENTAATVAAGGTTTLNFNVTAGEPAFRIQQVMKPTTLVNAPAPVRTGVAVKPGQTVYVGVSGNGIPADATFSITGDGIGMGGVSFQANRIFGSQNLLQAQITVATNATAGLRTIVARRGSDVAYANGYLEVSPVTIDYNFDGLDDRFQRQYFPLWTAAEAGPAADPDGDRFSNGFEAMTGTNPTNAGSFYFLIEAIEIIRGAPRVSWKSDVGKQYQLYGTSDLSGAAWQSVGNPVTATTNVTVQLDSAASLENRFYKLRLLP